MKKKEFLIGCTSAKSRMVCREFVLQVVHSITRGATIDVFLTEEIVKNAKKSRYPFSNSMSPRRSKENRGLGEVYRLLGIFPSPPFLIDSVYMGVPHCPYS